MRRPLKLATLAAVALAFTACVDSPRSPITEPDGLSFAKGTVTPLTEPEYALLALIGGNLNVLYSCETSRRGIQSDNKNKDLEKVKTYAEFGWWKASDQPDPTNVAYMVNKLITNTQNHITAGTLPASGTNCQYADEAERDALAEQTYEWLLLFASQEFAEENVSATNCAKESETDCKGSAYNGSFVIPPGTFDYDVIVLIKKNNGSPPDGFTPAPNSASVHFDVFPPGKANFPWNRYICYAGPNPGVPDELDDFPPSWIVMVRERGPGEPEVEEEGPLEFFETEEGAECTLVPSSSNAFLKGAYKLLAGLPIFPKTLQAYVPSREFGGPSPYSSPHWLTALDPTPPTGEWNFDSLCAETHAVIPSSPNTAGAACTHLNNAKTKIATGDNVGANKSIDSYIQVIGAQIGKSITLQQANYLVGIAESLRP